MNRLGVVTVSLVVALAALFPVASTVSQATPTSEPAELTISGCELVTPRGVVLVQPVAGGGAPQRGLRVIDPATGDEIGRIDLPPVSAAFPTGLSGRALAVAGGGLYLIDTRDLSAMRISLGGEPATDLSPNPVQFRGTAGTRYMLLGSPSFDRTFLIDVESGIATDLGELVVPPTPDAPTIISFAAVTPNDAHVLMWDGRHVYTVRTDVPEGARQIDTGAFAFAPDFSPTGAEVIYSQSNGPGSGSTLMQESIDGERSVEVASSEHALVTLWVPGGRTILVDARTETGAAAGSAYLLDLDSGQETPLLDYAGSLSTVQFHPDGSHALLGTEQMGATNWRLADLTTSEVREIPQLAGSRISPGLYADTRWGLATPSGGSTDPLSGPSYRSIDLESGDVGRLLEQSSDIRYTQPSKLSQDGRLSTVIGESNGAQTLWLLDAVELDALAIATGSHVTALFSADDCGVVVTTEPAIDGVLSAIATIFSFNGDAPTSFPGSRAVAWIASGQPVG